ncbi:MAG: M67 family metallopeptidase [Chloroflexi bacterium]|nr:M67 family metallopeptidase [Chloroflexota bacterium]
MKLPRAIVDEMIAHAKAESPNECCGILAGTNGNVLRLYRTTNAEASPVKYTIASRDLYRVYREVEDKGWEIIAFYHSHTFSEAYPSPTDVRLATWPDSSYIIVSLQHPEHPVARSFKIQDGHIAEEPLEIEHTS